MFIGGVNVQNIDKTVLMNTVSFVFQNSRLIKGTILDNVKMARPDATNEEVLQAIHKAQCDDIIKKFPEGINTVIGTHGTLQMPIKSIFLKTARLPNQVQMTNSLQKAAYMQK